MQEPRPRLVLGGSSWTGQNRGARACGTTRPDFEFQPGQVKGRHLSSGRIIMIPVFILFYSLILFVTLAALFRRIWVFRSSANLSSLVVPVCVSFTVSLSLGFSVLLASCLLHPR